jgi:hypothetical protein
MSVADWSVVGTLAASAANVATLVIVAWQLRSLAAQTREAARQAEASAEAVKSSVYLDITKMMVEIDQFLLERPHLRAELYGPAENHETDALAEMIIDFFDAIVAHQQHLSGGVSDGWNGYFRHLMVRSPTLRRWWRDNRTWYGTGTQEVLDPATEP